MAITPPTNAMHGETIKTTTHVCRENVNKPIRGRGRSPKYIRIRQCQSPDPEVKAAKCDGMATHPPVHEVNKAEKKHAPG